MKNYLSQFTGLLIRMDDITENMKWDFMDRCETLFEKFNIKPLLGVIPENQDTEFSHYPKKFNFWNKVREWEKKNWEISMHGFTHVYDQETNKKDFFGYGGRSEFFGHDYQTQLGRITKGLEKLKREKLNIRSFFAPNHTYDENTFAAIKDAGIKNVIDGYGLVPYTQNGLNFFPQLFYKEIFLPFGIQATQIHLNYWNENDCINFENFIEKNHQKIISFDQCLEKINNNIFGKLINFGTKNTLKTIRFFK
jgi:predicted deacetylase